MTSFAEVKFAIYLGLALVPSLLLHEHGHALAATRLGDQTPRLYGRLGFNLKTLADPFGTVILPGLLLLLRAVGIGVPVFAYAKPMPRNPNVLANPDRDTTLIALAGPAVNLVLAIVAGALFRVVNTGELGLLVLAALIVNVTFFVFYLMPIPGLDGALILSRYLPPRAREVYRNLDQYLPLWMLLIFFLLAAPVLSFVQALSRAVCNLVSGVPCF